MRTLLLATIAVLGIIRIVSGDDPLKCYWNNLDAVDDENTVVTETKGKKITEQLKKFLRPSEQNGEFNRITKQLDKHDTAPCDRCVAWRTPKGLMQFCMYKESDDDEKLMETEWYTTHYCNNGCDSVDCKTKMCNTVTQFAPERFKPIRCYHGEDAFGDDAVPVTKITYEQFYDEFDKIRSEEKIDDDESREKQLDNKNKMTDKGEPFEVPCTHCMKAESLNVQGKLPLCGYYETNKGKQRCKNEHIECCYESGCNSVKEPHVGKKSKNFKCYVTMPSGRVLHSYDDGLILNDTVNAITNMALKLTDNEKENISHVLKFQKDLAMCDKCADVTKTIKGYGTIQYRLCLPVTLAKDFCKKDGFKCCENHECNKPLQCYDSENDPTQTKMFDSVKDDDNKDHKCGTCAVSKTGKPPMQSCLTDTDDCKEKSEICCTSDGCNKLLRCYTNEINKTNTNMVYTTKIHEFLLVQNDFGNKFGSSALKYFERDPNKISSDWVSITCKSCATFETKQGPLQMCFYADKHSDECNQDGMTCCDDEEKDDDDEKPCNYKKITCFQGKNNETVTNTTIKTFWNYLSFFAIEEMNYPNYPEYGLGQEMNNVTQCLHCLSIKTKYGTLPLCGFHENGKRLCDNNTNMAGGSVTCCMTDFCNDIGYKMVEGQATNLRNTAVTTILFSLITLSLFPFPY